LVSAQQFEKLTAHMGDEDPRGVYPLIDRIMANDDVNDPLLDTYQ
jgi:hypothetical protein